MRPDAVFVAWRDFGKLPAKEFAARAPQVVAKLKVLPTAGEPKAQGKGTFGSMR